MTALVPAAVRGNDSLRTGAVVAVGAAVSLAAAEKGSGAAGLVIGGVIGVVLLIVARLHPVACVGVLVVSTPLAPLLPAGLLRAGFPIAVVRQYGSLKDLCVLGVVLALTVPGRRRPGHLDAVEITACLYVSLVLAYTALPLASAGLQAPPRQVRELGARLAVEWVILAVALRRMVLSDRERTLMARAVVAVAALEGLAAVFQFLQESAWNSFVVTTLGYPAYQQNVLGVGSSQTTVLFTNTFGSVSTVRVGGLGLNPLTTGALCLVLVAAIATRVAVQLRALEVAALGLVAAALVLTLTRSAVLGAAVGLVVALAGRRPSLRGRSTIAAVVAVGALALAPVAAGSTLGERIASAVNGTDSSTADHQRSTSAAIDQVGSQPLGAGLGTGPAVGYRFTTNAVTAENAYVQISLELGFAGATAFSALLLAMAADLRRRAQAATSPAIAAAGALGAVVGLIVMSFLLDPWVDYPTVLLLGVVVGLAGGTRAERTG